jgi:hypothetical protein
MWQELCCAWMVTAANVEKATKLILAIVYGLWIGAGSCLNGKGFCSFALDYA